MSKEQWEIDFETQRVVFSWEGNLESEELDEIIDEFTGQLKQIFARQYNRDRRVELSRSLKK